jgi:hypothetical protein
MPTLDDFDITPVQRKDQSHTMVILGGSGSPALWVVTARAVARSAVVVVSR